jgi:NOL1/NOP2/fmu family ribosome biogenesis protein
MNNIRVLDLCGAPGGKSTLISDLLGDNSMLVANEVIRSRAAILSETIAKWGRCNTIVTGSDPSAFGKIPGYFDVIFVDAPCSGEGMFRNSVAVGEWSVANTDHCAERQKRILMDIWPALKENGTLIYSTCTFNPGENEENISWLISKSEAECVKIDISGFPGITQIDYQGISGYGFYPGRVKGEGFFISVIRKTGKQEKYLIRNLKKPELIPGRNDFEIADRWTSFQKNRLMRWGDELYAIPCELNEYINLFQILKIVKGGSKICTMKKEDFLPAHDLALSEHLKTDAFPCHEIDLKQAIAYLRRDNFVVPDTVKNWNIVRYKGVNVGFIKNITKRINNYFPVEWRIRMNTPEQGKENLLEWK